MECCALGIPFLKVTNLSFKFKQYPRTESGANGFENTKWQHLLGISDCSGMFFSSKTGRNWKKNIWTQVEHMRHFQLESALYSYL